MVISVNPVNLAAWYRNSTSPIYDGNTPLIMRPPIQSFDKIIAPETAVGDRFTGVTAGQRVGLTDGTYVGFNAGQIPDFVAVEAVNHGMVTINGGDQPTFSDAVFVLDGEGQEGNGLRVGNPTNTMSNAAQIDGINNTLKNTACYNGGSHKHKIPLRVSGTGHLVEDCWAWGVGRYTMQSFIATFCTFRRCVARWDATIANEDTEPNATFSCYNSSDMLWENCISLDYGFPETPMDFGGDFYQPQNAGIYPYGNQDNRFLGNFAVNHSDNTNNQRAYRMDYGTVASGNVLDNFYVRINGTVYVSNPNASSCSIGNITAIDVGSLGDVSTADPTPIVPTGPAETEFQYLNGALTATPLWPWPNEVRIIADFTGPDNRRSTNPAETAYQSPTNYGYSAWNAGSLSLKDYIGV